MNEKAKELFLKVTGTKEEDFETKRELMSNNVFKVCIDVVHDDKELLKVMSDLHTYAPLEEHHLGKYKTEVLLEKYATGMYIKDKLMFGLTDKGLVFINAMKQYYGTESFSNIADIESDAYDYIASNDNIINLTERALEAYTSLTFDRITSMDADDYQEDETGWPIMNNPPVDYVPVRISDYDDLSGFLEGYVDDVADSVDIQINTKHPKFVKLDNGSFIIDV